MQDPAEGFQRLRDAVDTQWCVDSWRKGRQGSPLKIIPSQIEFVEQVLRFRDLSKVLDKDGCKDRVCGKVARVVEGCCEPVDRPREESDDNNRARESEREWKAFRLQVKRSILAKNGDLRGLCKADMQAALTEEYSLMESRFRHVCGRQWVWAAQESVHLGEESTT